MNNIGKKLNPLRIIIIEDSINDAAVIIQYLEQLDRPISAVRVKTREDFKTVIQEPFDLILADYQNPQFTITYALTLLRQAKIEKPFIVFSEPIGEEKVVLLLKTGVSDFILKKNIKKIHQAVKKGLIQKESIEEKKGGHEEQDVGEPDLQQGWQTASIGQWFIDFQRMIVNCSEEVFRIFALDPQRFHKKNLHFFRMAKKEKMPTFGIT